MFTCKKRRALPMLALATVFGAGIASLHVARADEAGTHTELEAIYKTAGEALQAKDYPTFFAFEADDFVSVDEDGKETQKVDADAHTQKGLEAFKEIKSIDTELGDVQTEGDDTGIDVTQKVAAVLTDDKGADHTINILSKGHDTWTKTDAGWRIKRSKNIETKMDVDGTPVP